MKCGWRVILSIVLIAALLGAVCVGVGLITGGEWARIYSTLDSRYHVAAYVDYVQQVIAVFQEALFSPAA